MAVITYALSATDTPSGTRSALLRDGLRVHLDGIDECRLYTAMIIRLPYKHVLMAA